MSNFAIMRNNKIKTKAAVAASLKHNFREQETPNADPQKTGQNQHLPGRESTEQALAYLDDRLATLERKPRANAVLAVEYLVTASPEWMAKASKADEKEFFKQAGKWITDKYGAENVITASIHRDETTPHMAFYVVPITDDGRLSAKDHIGNREKMRSDQDSFAAAVEHLGLKRGIKGSKAQHEKISTFYGRLESAEPEAIPKVSSTKFSPDKKGSKELAKAAKEAFTPKKTGGNLLASEYETPDQVLARASKELGLNAPAEALAARSGTFKEIAAQERVKANKAAERLSGRPELPKNVSIDEANRALAFISQQKQNIAREERAAERAKKAQDRDFER